MSRSCGEWLDRRCLLSSIIRCILVASSGSELWLPLCVPIRGPILMMSAWAISHLLFCVAIIRSSAAERSIWVAACAGRLVSSLGSFPGVGRGRLWATFPAWVDASDAGGRSTSAPFLSFICAALPAAAMCSLRGCACGGVSPISSGC